MARASSNSKYTEPHERKDGPWEDYELDDAGRHIETAEKIKANPKFVAAIADHHEKKATEVSQMAKTMRRHMRRGSVSSKALANAAKKHKA